MHVSFDKKKLRIDAQHKQFDIIINILISGIMISNALRFITGFQISNYKNSTMPSIVPGIYIVTWNRHTSIYFILILCYG